MKPISKEKLTRIRDAMNRAFAEIAKAEGLASFQAGRCTFDRAGGFVWKVEGVEKGGLTREQQRYNALREEVYGDLPLLDTSIPLAHGETGIVRGANSTGSKVIIERGGKQYLYVASHIAELARKMKAAAKT